MRIWQRPIVGHVQMTFIVNRYQISAYQIQKVESSQTFLYGLFWLAGELPWDGNNKGHLHMTCYGPLSDLHTIVMKSCILIRLHIVEKQHNCKYIHVLPLRTTDPYIYKTRILASWHSYYEVTHLRRLQIHGL